MILDVSKVALADGAEKAAVDVSLGTDICSSDRTVRHTQLVRRDIRDSDDIICLCLSNGRKLCASTDQKVGMIRKNGRLCYTVLSDILPGDKIRGQCQGVEIVLNVDGVLFYPKHRVRLVRLITNKNRSFIAEGVSCR